jgi:dTDP-4-amino-4,6-dideoxygalactose transaminase
VLLAPHLNQQQVMQALLDRGIATRRGVMCIHREAAYAAQPLRFKLPNSEYVQDHGLIIPLFSGMTDDEQHSVVEAILEVVNQHFSRP